MRRPLIVNDRVCYPRSPDFHGTVLACRNRPIAGLPQDVRIRWDHPWMGELPPIWESERNLILVSTREEAA